MIEKSKLSSRFKKEKAEPVKFVLEKPQELLVAKEVEEIDLKQELLQKIETVPVWFDYSVDEQKTLIKSFVSKKITDDNVDKCEIAEKLYSEINGFGALEYLLNQENVTAVFVNGTNSVHIEIAGKILNTEMKLSKQELSFISNYILNKAGIKSNKQILNFKFENFSISIIKPEIATCGTNISIRKNVLFEHETLIENGFMSRDVFEFLISAISSKKNIVISGDINCGKTTLLDVLIKSLIKNKRSVLLEESSQITSDSDNLIKFLIEDYSLIIANILKMTPEYILTDFNKAVVELSERNGIISTLRASSVEAAVSKLISEFISTENLPEKSAKNSVLRNYDYIVQINKTDEGVSKITSIAELTPAKTAALSIKKVDLLY